MEKKSSRTDSVLLFFLLLVLTIVVESIARGNSKDTFSWLMINTKEAAFNFAIIISLWYLCFAILAAAYSSYFVTSITVLLLALVSHYKYHFLQQPLLPWDFSAAKQVASLLPHLANELHWKLFAGVGITLLALHALRKIMPKIKVRLRWRLTGASVAVFLLVSIVFYRETWMATFMNKLQIENVAWVQAENYKTNGLLLGFFMNVHNVMVQPPPNYNEQNLQADLRKMKADTLEVSLPQASAINPDIIFVMSEAFWDPTRMSVTVSEDPLPTYRKLTKQGMTGNLLSPSFGGDTANTEFEVLTGFSMGFLPQGSIPYQQYVNKPYPSLAHYLEQKGYQAIAIHSNDGWFYERNKVYPFLGFQKFISKENFINPQYKGMYMADSEVCKQIIQQTDSAKQPTFIFAVTMQNHGPYNDQRYGVNRIKVVGNLSDSSKQMVETYTQGASDADASLKMLIDHYKKSKRPTMVVFFGDHLPYLGKDYQAYRETGYVQSTKEADWSLEERKNMKSTPFVIWTNFAHPKVDTQTVSPPFLAAKVLDVAKIDKSVYYSFLSNLSKSTPGFTSTVKIDANGGLHDKSPDDTKEQSDLYWELEYDFMFGKQFAKDLMLHQPSS